MRQHFARFGERVVHRYRAQILVLGVRVGAGDELVRFLIGGRGVAQLHAVLDAAVRPDVLLQPQLEYVPIADVTEQILREQVHRFARAAEPVRHDVRGHVRRVRAHVAPAQLAHGLRVAHQPLIEQHRREQGLVVPHVVDDVHVFELETRNAVELARVFVQPHGRMAVAVVRHQIRVQTARPQRHAQQRAPRQRRDPHLSRLARTELSSPAKAILLDTVIIG